MPNKYEWALSFFSFMALETYSNYCEKNISKDIFFNSMKDIKIWSEECHRKYGVYGLEEIHWIIKSINLDVIRLGRLQYESIVLDRDICVEKQLFRGQKVINIHIPEDGRLEYELCIQSLEMARGFFVNETNIFFCESWLLSPKLKELLSCDNNIIKFQNLFDICELHFNYSQAEQRIFKDILEDKSKYPEDTFLRKKAKPLYIKGEDIGIGIGVIKQSYI